MFGEKRANMRRHMENEYADTPWILFLSKRECLSRIKMLSKLKQGNSTIVKLQNQYYFNFIYLICISLNADMHFR